MQYFLSILIFLLLATNDYISHRLLIKKYIRCIGTDFTKILLEIRKMYNLMTDIS